MITRKCTCCCSYVNINDWPIYNGKPYAYCRDCKRFTQRLWIRQKREMLRSK